MKYFKKRLKLRKVKNRASLRFKVNQVATVVKGWYNASDCKTIEGYEHITGLPKEY